MSIAENPRTRTAEQSEQLAKLSGIGSRGKKNNAHAVKIHNQRGHNVNKAESGRSVLEDREADDIEVSRGTEGK